MIRRTFLTVIAAAMLPTMLHAAPLDYTPGLIEQRLAAGEVVFVDYKASWCGTCKAQGRVIGALLAENPAYEQHVTFINVDWDTYKGHEIVAFHNIPRRSTLIVLTPGGKEIGRIVAGTSREEIKALMDAALAAGQS